MKKECYFLKNKVGWVRNKFGRKGFRSSEYSCVIVSGMNEIVVIYRKFSLSSINSVLYEVLEICMIIRRKIVCFVLKC